ncbi:DNA-binding protein [Photobacterium leiognathi subsp. mandapamensis]|uniref:DNA-binding protein n=1 Tax=Photobacterium leiognathi TaxID=553611 RepID=UPI003AF3E163
MFQDYSKKLTHEERVQLGIKGCLKSGHRPYDESELQYLIDNYGVISLKQIAIDLGRTYYSVVDKRQKLIEHNVSFYTKDEDNFIRNNANKLTSYAVAKKLNRTRASVAQRAARLGVLFIKVSDASPKTIYPQEDIDLIRELRDAGLSYYSIGQKFEIHKEYVRQLCNFERRLYDDTELYHQMLKRQQSAIDGLN